MRSSDIAQVTITHDEGVKGEGMDVENSAVENQALTIQKAKSVELIVRLNV